MMKKRLGIALFALLALGLAACSGVLTSKQPAKQYYALMPLAGTAGPAPADAPVLALEVRAVPGFDTDRLLALGQDARLHRVGNLRWPDHLPEVITSVLKRSLAASGQFSEVVTDAARSGEKWWLKVEIQQFYGLRNAAGETQSVHLEMAASVACEGHQLRYQLTDTQTVGGDSDAAIVAAHQLGLDRVTEQLLSRIQSACGS